MWFTAGSLDFRVMLAVASMGLNGRMLQLIVRCRRQNEDNVHKLFCLLYATIPLFFILFSILELLTLNVHITGTHNFNLVGQCNGIHIQHCGMMHGWQIACFIHNLLVIPVLFYFRRALITEKNLEEEFNRSPCFFFQVFGPCIILVTFGFVFGFVLGSIQFTEDYVHTNPELLKSHIGFMMYDRMAPFDVTATTDQRGFYLVLGAIWPPAYVLSWAYYRTIPFSKVAPGINVESEKQLARALLLGLVSTSIWPIIYLLYNVPLVFLNFPAVPLDLVMVSFNLVPVLFPLLQWRFVFRHRNGAALVAPRRPVTVLPYLSSEELAVPAARSVYHFSTFEETRTEVDRTMWVVAGR